MLILMLIKHKLYRLKLYFSAKLYLQHCIGGMWSSKTSNLETCV